MPIRFLGAHFHGAHHRCKQFLSVYHLVWYFESNQRFEQPIDFCQVRSVQQRSIRRFQDNLQPMLVHQESASDKNGTIVPEQCLVVVL